MTTEQEPIGLTEAIQAIRQEIYIAEKASKKEVLRFKHDRVELEFEVAITRTGKAEGGIKFWIVNFGVGGERGSSKTHRVKMILTPERLQTDGTYRPEYTGDESDEIYDDSDEEQKKQ